jgi:hypothetical protein
MINGGVMKEIPLTKGKVAFVDDADYAAVMAVGKWYAHLNSNGRYYARRIIQFPNGKRTILLMHRWILGLTDPKTQVDHKNREATLNNTRGNLRVATNAQNNQNKGKTKRNTNGVIGVYWDKQRNKWRPRITVNGKTIYPGRYSTLEAARAARDAAVLKYHGEFGVTNAMLAAAA